MSVAESPVLQLRGIKKSFGNTKALKGVDFELRCGEIHALAGENGAGKSTLMKIIDGIYQPDDGVILFNNQPETIKGPLAAQRLGVHFVHQEISLCGDVSVAENIMMASTNRSSSFFVNFKAMERKASDAIAQLADIDPTVLVSSLSISNQQLVEIVKALVADCKILILDEPTSALTEKEANILFSIMRRLKAQGISIIYISHRMAEIFNECDRVTVFRDGEHVSTQNINDVTPNTIVNDMVGRTIDDLYPRKYAEDVEKNRCILDVNSLTDNVFFHDVSFSVYEQEIFGVAGLIGAGRSEVMQSVCGLHKRKSGTIHFYGRELRITNYQHGIEHGIVYLSENRKDEGVFLELSIEKNISAMKPENVSNFGFINRSAERNQATKLTEKLNLKSDGMSENVSSLSGGNQQKVAIAKILSVHPKLIILDEPTRGIDVGAKSEIHKMIRELANAGVGIIVISSELPEIVGLSDRVMVMCEGENAGILTADQVTEENIMHLASGVNKLTVN